MRFYLSVLFGTFDKETSKPFGYSPFGTEFEVTLPEELDREIAKLIADEFDRLNTGRLTCIPVSHSLVLLPK